MLSSVGMPDGTIALYDSLLGTTFTTTFMRDIAHFCHPSGAQPLLYTMNVQGQHDSFSCGIHVAAFATSLAHGKDPCQLCYFDVGKHLQDSFSKGQRMQFPAEVIVQNKRIMSTFTIEIHCLCHGIGNGTPMVACYQCK